MSSDSWWALQVFNTECVIDEVAIEMECIWDGSQKFQLAIRPFPRLPVGEGPPMLCWAVLELCTFPDAKSAMQSRFRIECRVSDKSRPSPRNPPHSARPVIGFY